MVTKFKKYLHDYWNNPSLNEGERFLRDYILNKRYLDADDESDDDDATTADRNKKEDVLEKKVDPVMVNLSEDEEIIEKQETFERKYNFRFEEPDVEFIKSYPRTITDTVRRKDNKRKLKREEYKERKNAEKQKKKEEIKRLKNLKRNEILEKINKIKMVTGNDDLDIEVDDLDKDFDTLEHDKRMQVTLKGSTYLINFVLIDFRFFILKKIFDSNFYQTDENEKPVFSDSDPDLQSLCLCKTLIFAPIIEWFHLNLKVDDYEDWATDANEIEDYEENDLPGKKKKKSKKMRETDEPDENEDFNVMQTAESKISRRLA
jgi:hypothetical protein